MTTGTSHAIISEWIEAMNTHDTEAYVSYFSQDAVLDDPSVGERFDGRAGIAEYFTRYFIAYDTTTRLLGITPSEGGLHVEVEFTGTFPGGRTGGVFDVTLAGDKISFVHADLT